MNAILCTCAMLFASTACEKDVAPEAVQISLALEEPTVADRTVEADENFIAILSDLSPGLV